MRVYPNVRLWSVKEPGGSMILQVGCIYNTLAALLRRSEFLGKVLFQTLVIQLIRLKTFPKRSDRRKSGASVL